MQTPPPQPFVYPYDIGKLANVRQVFGDMAMLWWFPGPVQGTSLVVAMGVGIHNLIGEWIFNQLYEWSGGGC